MNLKRSLITALMLSTTLAVAEVFTSNTTIAVGDATYDGQPIVVSNCTLTVNGPHSFASLWLTNGAVLTHAPAPNGETNNRLDLAIANDAVVDATSRIDASGGGYGSGAGPGAGFENGSGNGGGGGHGGRGGDAPIPYGSQGGGSIYGQITAPNQWGSGGGSGYYSTPGAGGGLVRLVVSGALRVDGLLNADGASSTRPSLGSYAGGGSGGSIWLSVGQLAGAGIISANGGAGVNGGGGGGGRIAIHYAANAFSGSLTATGGTGFQRGGAGTIFTRNTAAAGGQVRVDNAGNAGAPTVLNATLWPVGETFDLVASGAAVVYPEGAVTLANLRVNDGAILSHAVQARTFNLTVINNAVIETNGQINVAGRGYPTDTGPGAGGMAFNGNAGGGGHGGRGGGAQIPYSYMGGGGTYDSPTQPADFGSGGGDYRGGAGGGVIRMDVFGTLQLDGQINAAGASVVDNHYGGGAGGSVWLQLGALTGSGFISAAAGWSGGPGGGGGGGRVAIYCGSFSGFDTNRITAAGGYGGTYGELGGDGTIRLLPLGQITPPLTFTRGSGQALLVWPGFSGLNYQLLTATNLAIPNWVATGAPLAGQGGWLSNSVPINSIPEQYFRLQVFAE